MRTAREYLAEIDDGRVVWLGQNRIESVVTSPFFRNAANSFAALYDAASNPAAAELYTYTEQPGSRRRHKSFQIPMTLDDLAAKRRMHEAWAKTSFGFLGRSPDYIASGLAGFCAAVETFHAHGYDGREAVKRLYNQAADNSRFISFTLTNIKRDRRVPLSQQNDRQPDIGVRSVCETDAGIYVSGAKAIGTAAIFSDEIIVGSIEPLSESDIEYALTFSVRPATRGVTLVTRSSYEAPTTPLADNPLSSRFDENDAILILDEVFVPWEHVLTFRDPRATSSIWWETPAYVNMAHQASIRYAVKLQFLAGLACLAAKANGLSDNSQVRSTLGRLIGYVQIARSMVLGAEAGCQPISSNPQAVAPNREIVYAQRILAAELYPKFVHELRMICGGSLIYAPCSISDLDHPEIGPVLRSYLTTVEQTATDRARLLKLIWDATSTEFAARHAHYEQFYQGAPHVYFQQMATEDLLTTCGNFAAEALDLTQIASFGDKP